jgi:hypothetical protein
MAPGKKKTATSDAKGAGSRWRMQHCFKCGGSIESLAESARIKTIMFDGPRGHSRFVWIHKHEVGK